MTAKVRGLSAPEFALVPPANVIARGINRKRTVNNLAFFLIFFLQMIFLCLSTAGNQHFHGRPQNMLFSP
jgi:hypothetical protein